VSNDKQPSIKASAYEEREALNTKRSMEQDNGIIGGVGVGDDVINDCSQIYTYIR